MSLCLFYSGNLKESINQIEKHIYGNPKRNLNESVIFNLCTLYDLESSKTQKKKLSLLLWLNVYAGDGFHETCLQFNNV
jgi:trafficking protein particle complex subunit 12